jgi:hypothetical protein
MQTIELTSVGAAVDVRALTPPPEDEQPPDDTSSSGRSGALVKRRARWRSLCGCVWYVVRLLYEWVCVRAVRHVRRLLGACGEGGQRRPLLPTSTRTPIHPGPMPTPEGGGEGEGWLTDSTSTESELDHADHKARKGLLRRRADGGCATSSTHAERELELERAMEEGGAG